MDYNKILKNNLILLILKINTAYSQQLSSFEKLLCKTKEILCKDICTRIVSAELFHGGRKLETV